MTTLLFHALAFLSAGARMLVSKTWFNLSTQIKSLFILRGFSPLPSRELIESLVTLLARLWLWRHDRKSK
jgi:hypothetical protein